MATIKDAEDLKARIKKVSKDVDNAHWVLGRAFVELGEMEVDHNGTPVRVLGLWGYSSLNKFADAELRMSSSTVLRLRSNYLLFGVIFAKKYDHSKYDLGTTQMDTLRKILTPQSNQKTVDKWCDLAKNSTVYELRNAIARELSPQEGDVTHFQCVMKKSDEANVRAAISEVLMSSANISTVGASLGLIAKEWLEQHQALARVTSAKKGTKSPKKNRTYEKAINAV